MTRGTPFPRLAWSEHRLLQMCERHGDQVSFATIAGELNCSRSAAIGAFNRLRAEAEEALCGRYDEFVERLSEYDRQSLADVAAAMRIPVEFAAVRLAEIRRRHPQHR